MSGGVLIRQLEARQTPAVEFAFAHLSPQSRLQRYLAVKPALSPAELAHLTAVDHWHHEALLALSPVPRAPIGLARYVRGERFDVAEVAIEVTDAWQRRGVGTALVSELVHRARGAGIRRFEATLMAQNAGARRLMLDLGQVRLRARSAGVLELEVAL